MKLPATLNLMIIDDNQLYAEQLVNILENNYYQKVNLGFLDAKDELIKLLRQSWDVLVMGKAYDLTLPDVTKILKQQEIDLPMIAIVPEEGLQKTLKQPLDAKEQGQMMLVSDDDATDKSLPLYIYWGAVDALPKNRLMEMALRVQQQHKQLLFRNQLAELRKVLSDAEQRANILIKNSKSAVAYIEQGLHIYANEPYLKMFGYKSMNELMGMPVVDLIASNNIKDFKQFLRDFERGNRSNVEFKFESIKNNGSTFAAKLQLAAATYEGQPCLQVIIQPNEQANSAELAKKLAVMERIDPLTKIANRRGFEEALTIVREMTIQQYVTSGLLCVRLDNIGKINSSLGIQGVDTTILTITQFLKEQMAELLTEDFVKKGYLSRFNDASFMIIVPNIEQETLTQWVEKLIATIADSMIEVGNRTVKTTISVGGTMLNSSSPEVSTLIDRVMEAVDTVRSKTNDEGNAFHLYDPTSFANSDDGALLEALQVAIEQNKFQLFYQPIYDIEQDNSNFFEVFLRLPLADGSLMKPDQFLNIAEKHHLMDKIDRWMLISACKMLREYRNIEPNARLLIHLSAKSLVDSNLPTFIAQLIQAVGGNSQQTLSIQFNETMLTDHMAVAVKQIEALKAIHCGVGIYSFGSAVNAMEILETIKPNLVRLDASYIKDLSNSDNVETIKSLISQITEYECETLMAFIENPAIMSTAWTVGARYLQGDYLQAPSLEMTIQTEQS